MPWLAGDSTWASVLHPLDARHTRLIERWRLDFRPACACSSFGVWSSALISSCSAPNCATSSGSPSGPGVALNMTAPKLAEHQFERDPWTMHRRILARDSPPRSPGCDTGRRCRPHRADCDGTVRGRVRWQPPWLIERDGDRAERIEHRGRAHR
jgi:hypothetical protein